MRSELKNRVTCCFLSGVTFVLLYLGFLCVQIPGDAGHCSDFSDFFNTEKKELAQALLSEGNSLARLLRSSRQRNNSQGRILSSRNGNGAVPQLPWEDELFPFAPAEKSSAAFHFCRKNSFWTDFIISALPERAGPLCA